MTWYGDNHKNNIGVLQLVELEKACINQYSEIDPLQFGKLDTSSHDCQHPS